MTIAYISHHDCQLHDMGHHHPEQPARLSAINDRLIATGLEMVLHQYDAPLATRELLEAVHDSSYIDEIYAASPSGGIAWLDGDTAMNKHSLTAALRAAGAVAMGVDLVMEGKAKQVFCGVRPPGHHAEHHRAMGFCLLNHAAVASRHAQSVHGVERVAILDFDAHHGNGTQGIFENSTDVLYVSSHQMPLYPGTGYSSETGSGNILNLPLAPGAGGKEFQAAWSASGLPALERFKPDLIIISAGFDAHARDPLAQLELQDEDYGWITGQICAYAAADCGGRVISILEGGYDLDALASASAAHVSALTK